MVDPRVIVALLLLAFGAPGYVKAEWNYKAEDACAKQEENLKPGEKPLPTEQCLDSIDSVRSGAGS